MGDPADGYFEIYTTSDAGSTWTRVPWSAALVPFGDDEYGFRNNFTVNGNAIWALTTYGRILKSVDKGHNWSVSQSPVVDFSCEFGECPPPHMAFSDLDNGLMFDRYQLYKTTDGAATWEEVSWTGPIRNFQIEAVPGLPNTYLTVGLDPDLNQPGSSYSIDGGSTWVDINNNPDLVHVNGGVISMLNEDYGFASGFSNFSYPRRYISVGRRGDVAGSNLRCSGFCFRSVGYAVSKSYFWRDYHYRKKHQRGGAL